MQELGDNWDDKPVRFLSVVILESYLTLDGTSSLHRMIY